MRAGVRMLIRLDSQGTGDFSADLVIVGAGAAGITLARQFANTRTSVLLLESGGLERDEAQQDLYKGSLTGVQALPLHVSRLRYFGGSTNHWGGWSRPLETEDFASRPDWPESGWPITRATLDAYYPAASQLVQLGPTAFDDLGFWQQQKGGAQLRALPLQTDRLRTSLFQVSPPTRFGERFRQELEAASNVKVLLGANVLELLPGKQATGSGKRIGGLVVTNDAGRHIKISGKEFVLAVGGIETPRILLSSTQLHANGTGNEHDLVGRYFQDHPWLTSSAVVRYGSASTLPTNWPLYFDTTELAGAKVFGALTPDRKRAIEAGIGAFRLWLRPNSVSTQGMDALRQTYGELRAGKLPDRLAEQVGSVLADWDVIANNVYKTAFKRQKDLLDVGTGKILGASIDLNFEQRPRFDSRVSLGKSEDRFGVRRVVVDWRLGDDDRHTASTALQWAAEAFGQIGLGRIRITTDLQKGKPWPEEMTGSSHHMGTARMAAAPERGVVNADCRVHSVDNLYIAGSAVFPTSGYANPTLTIVALALRLSDHLKGKLS
jgi:choline dehydrogenase-like flavoprotein